METFSWYDRDEFAAIFEREHQSSRHNMHAFCFFESTPEKVIERIPLKPVDSPIDGDDPPGPMFRWYGSISGYYFLLDLPSDESMNTVVCPQFTAEPEAIPYIEKATVEYFDATIDGKSDPSQ